MRMIPWSKAGSQTLFAIAGLSSLGLVTMPASAKTKLPAAARAYRPVVAPPRRSLESYPVPILPFEPDQPLIEPAPDTTLAEAIDQAYRTNPTLAARRYELRATDENLAQALSELRPTAQIQVTGGYDKTVPGRITEASRPLADRLRSSSITRNDLGAQLIIDQPLVTGGRASADIASASMDIRSGREALRGAEGDLLAQVITAYVDVRRDTKAFSIRHINVRALEATLDEVGARRDAGELTRTDVAQAETQLESARVQFNIAEAQREQSRAVYAALVGSNPSILAPEPRLPNVPRSLDDAFNVAETRNPELSQALFAERASRARISAARAAGRPTLVLRGTASLTGQAAPFHLYNDDQGFAGRATLTVPLTSGGRNRSLVAQASDRNSADRLRIDGTRRLMVQNIVIAWNQMATAKRNLIVQQHQLNSVTILNEGMVAEYRAGLRSTFDVLFAQNSLRDTQIGLITSQHDLYVAEANLLRHIGLLEEASLMTGTSLYDAADHVRIIKRRNDLPWDGAIRAIDHLSEPGHDQQRIEQPERRPDVPRIAPAGQAAGEVPLAKESPVTPIPGTVGAPRRRRPR